MGNSATKNVERNTLKSQQITKARDPKHYNMGDNEQIITTQKQNNTPQTIAGLAYMVTLDFVTHIDISCSNITNIDTLPFGLVTLNISRNKLRKLPVLPNSLTKLDCSNNMITGTLELNDNLQILRCMNNKITNIVTFTDITEVSNANGQRNPQGKQKIRMIVEKKYMNTANLCPSGLQELNCHTNKLTTLPKLNEGLVNLFCENYELRELSRLPTTLEYCDFNVVPPNTKGKMYDIKWTIHMVKLSASDIKEFNKYL